MYDDDEDRMLSERDLYMPFITFADELYEEVYLADLPRILAQLNVKINLNRASRDREGESTKTRGTREREALTFKEFARIFELTYPAIVDDFLFYIAKYRSENREIGNLLKSRQTEDSEKEEEAEPWKDREVRAKVAEILENSPKTEKVMQVFRQLSANPRRGEHLQYITLGSLTKNFVRFSHDYHLA